MGHVMSNTEKYSKGLIGLEEYVEAILNMGDYGFHCSIFEWAEDHFKHTLSNENYKIAMKTLNKVREKELRIAYRKDLGLL